MFKSFIGFAMQVGLGNTAKINITIDMIFFFFFLWDMCIYVYYEMANALMQNKRLQVRIIFIIN